MSLFQPELYDCANPPTGGVRERLILYNFNDIDSHTEDADGAWTGITLKNNKVGFVFEGARNNVLPSATIRITAAGTFYNHLVQFFVHSKTQLTKNNLACLGCSPVVGVIEGLSKDLNAFEVLGGGRGMFISEGTRGFNDPDNSGAFVLTVSTPDDGAAEVRWPPTFNAGTSFTDNLDKINDTLNLPKVFNIAPVTGNTAGADSYTISGENFFNTATVPVADVTSLDFVDSVGALTNQAAFVVDNDGQISIASSVALAAGTFSIRVTTSAGTADSDKVLVIS